VQLKKEGCVTRRGATAQCFFEMVQSAQIITSKDIPKMSSFSASASARPSLCEDSLRGD
jgi:hypothetical protein